MNIYQFQAVQWLDVPNMKLNQLKNWPVNILHLLVFGLNLYWERAIGNIMILKYYYHNYVNYS